MYDTMAKRKDHKIYDQRNNKRKINKATDLILILKMHFKKGEVKHFKNIFCSFLFIPKVAD